MRIFDYALVANWDDRLAELAELAEPERWTYLAVPTDKPLPVLDSYVRHTFLRLAELERIEQGEALACFNTGLLTPSQEEIFGLFDIADKYDATKPIGPRNKKWFLKSWARAGDRVLTSFQKVPGLASYWNDPGELIFDPSLKVELNLDHIIRDNINRFPVELGGMLDANGVPTDVDPTEELEDPPEPAAATTKIPLALRNALEGSMKHSVRLAQRSYRVAVPQFHHGKVQLLLPLYMRDSGRVDLALTLEKHGDWYRAATVLYPDWAYRHARLLARPNSEWLGGFRSDLAVDG